MTVADSKCVNPLLRDVVPPGIGFGDAKCDRGSVLRLGRRMNDFAVDPSADADCEPFYRPDAPRALVVAAEDEQRGDI